MHNDRIADLHLIEDAARTAGAIGMGYFGRDIEKKLKAGNSPVTEADYAIDAHLKAFLCAARPDYGWLSEESEDDPARLDKPRAFVVDPIDGTRGFINGLDVWTISIAIVEDGRPTVAALYNPVRNEMMSARLGGGAQREGTVMQVHPVEAASLVVATSDRHLKHLALLSGLTHQRALASLAYQIGEVADGRLDGVSLSVGAHDWDLAAADLLVHEAGGILQGLDGLAPRYNRPETRHGIMIAGALSRVESLAASFRASPDAIPGRRRSGV